MSKKIPRFSVDPVPNCPPDIGRWLAIIDDARERLHFALQSVQDADLDAAPPIGINSIGTILYHLALTDLNWVYDNLLQQPYPDDIAHLFPYPLTNEQEQLSSVARWTLPAYQQRLAAARAKVHRVFSAMSIEAFREVLRREEDYGVYEVTPEAVLRHLAQHESEHRGEIQPLASALRKRE
ncbi:MAG: DinB family protein [Chloroflexales bacterium]|nr:DinB family protein [Chloroflexales bacterium]